MYVLHQKPLFCYMKVVFKGVHMYGNVLLMQLSIYKERMLDYKRLKVFNDSFLQSLLSVSRHHYRPLKSHMGK